MSELNLATGGKCDKYAKRDAAKFICNLIAFLVEFFICNEENSHEKYFKNKLI
jgi:hypothetical protein